MKDIDGNATTISISFEFIDTASHGSNGNNLSFGSPNSNSLILFELSQRSNVLNTRPHKIGSIKDILLNSLIDDGSLD